VVEVVRAGANVFVAGSAVFNRDDPLAAVEGILAAAVGAVGAVGATTNRPERRPDDVRGDPARGRCRHHRDAAGHRGGRAVHGCTAPNPWVAPSWCPAPPKVFRHLVLRCHRLPAVRMPR